MDWQVGKDRKIGRSKMSEFDLSVFALSVEFESL